MRVRMRVSMSMIARMCLMNDKICALICVCVVRAWNWKCNCQEYRLRTMQQIFYLKPSSNYSSHQKGKFSQNFGLDFYSHERIHINFYLHAYEFDGDAYNICLCGTYFRRTKLNENHTVIWRFFVCVLICVCVCVCIRMTMFYVFYMVCHSKMTSIAM